MTAEISTNAKRKRWNPFRIQREGGWMLYVWFGMRFGTWLKLLRAGRFDITLNTSPNVLAATVWSPVNSALALISEAVHRRRVARTEIAGPMVFVLGHWRTGTTLLHDLLAADPRFASPTTYDCLFPDHFVLSRPLVGDWFNVFLPKRRPMDAMPLRFDRPQEDEFALMNMGLPSPYRTIAFPRHGPVDREYLDLADLSAEERRRWSDGLHLFLRRLAYRAGRPLVLKSPPHTARVAALLDMFPDARFVYVARNPVAVLPSTIRLWRSLHSVQGLHNPANDAEWIEEHVLETFARMDAAYVADRDGIPPGRLAEVRYEDLVARPRQTMRWLYDALDLGDFAPAEAAIDDYLAGVAQYRARDYQPSARTCRAVLERWEGYIDRYGYRERIEAALADAQSAEAVASN